jgi:hypothetical protein
VKKKNFILKNLPGDCNKVVYNVIEKSHVSPVNNVVKLNNKLKKD